ncbi:hypothetical protein FF011L_34670 [Roseimaritima multifibrata]|uniref:Uncharacterized protein n=1 Tax=Roseimaritima multifibrata TaxID=1930274 RepID=A0A517MIR2_9BACT|nr:hypothetical protein FF011L_34670 [Roseimaritima multifibrata]
MADLDRDAFAGGFNTPLQFVGEHHLCKFALGVGTPGGVVFVEVQVLKLNSLHSHFVDIAADDHDASSRLLDPIEERLAQEEVTEVVYAKLALKTVHGDPLFVKVR